MTEHRYSRRVLVADYVRAGAGLALTAGPMALVSPAGLAFPVLGGLAALFVLFGARTALRQASRVVLDEGGLAVIGPFGAAVRWDELAGLRLRYFATRRDRANGWMQLTLRSPRGTVRIDSTIGDFALIARRAAAAAQARALPLTSTTVDNLRLFGVTLEDRAGTGS